MQVRFHPAVPRRTNANFLVLTGSFSPEQVTYCATGFLEKNTDTLQEDLRGLLLSSSIPFLRQVCLYYESNGLRCRELILAGFCHLS